MVVYLHFKPCRMCSKQELYSLHPVKQCIMYEMFLGNVLKTLTHRIMQKCFSIKTVIVGVCLIDKHMSLQITSVIPPYV